MWESQRRAAVEGGGGVEEVCGVEPATKVGSRGGKGEGEERGDYNECKQGKVQETVQKLECDNKGQGRCELGWRLGYRGAERTELTRGGVGRALKSSVQHSTVGGVRSSEDEQ